MTQTEQQLPNIAPPPCPICGELPTVTLDTMSWRVACRMPHGSVIYAATLELAALRWLAYCQETRK
jgi:hypothetical protein